MSIDFFRWAVVSHNDDSGLGRLAQDAKSVLGLRHLVIPSERLVDNPLDLGRDVLLPRDMSETQMEAALAGLDGLIMLERYWWHPLLLETAYRLGLRLTVLPTWEWFRGHETEWGLFHAILCPSQFSRKIVSSYGWKTAQVITVPLDLRRLPAREVSGPARLFVHNAGIVDPDDRKGTADTIRAFRRVKRCDVRLIVRVQKPAELPEPDERIEIRFVSLPDHGSLYTEGDVALQPSKMEGIGFMVIEPVVCGIPTVTLDYPPMSEHVLQPELRIRKRWFKRSCFPKRAAAVPHAHLRLPRMGDFVRRIEWCAEHDLTAISRANRARSAARYDAASLREEWSRVLGAL